MSRALILAAALLLGAEAVHGQVRSDCSWAGPAPVGIGIERLRCMGGECLINVASEDGGLEHRFTTEPRIERLRGQAPPELREGDVIVSIDGLPITTVAGGRSLARLEDGNSIELGIRREGRPRIVRLTPVAGCPIGSLEVRAPGAAEG